MGDRANIYLIDTEDATRGVYLYTHWSGEEWPEELRKALKAGQDRWNDPQYLARFVTTEVFKGLTGTSGGGLSTEIGDNAHPIIVVDLVNQVVAFAKEGGEGDRSMWKASKSYTGYVAKKAVYSQV